MLLSSTKRSINGVPCFTIEATDGKKLFLRQSVLAFNGAVYKIMTAGTTRTANDPRLAGVFTSLNILDPAPTAPVSKLSTQDACMMAAKVGIWVLIIAGIAAMILRSRRGRPMPPPLP